VSEEREDKVEETEVEQNDVEAHQRKHGHEADSTASDESDDVEAHVKHRHSD